MLTDWNDGRGFGFITSDDSGRRLFVHVSAFPDGRRPVAGCAVTYAVSHDRSDRPQASAVQFRGRGPVGRPGASAVPLALAVVTTYLALLVVLVAQDTVPVAVLVGYGVLSGATFCAYGLDKSAARRGAWRTPESTLHLLALAGGWPGAVVARPVFRHKTVKQPFRTMFWVTVLANCAALGWFVLVGAQAI